MNYNPYDDPDLHLTTDTRPIIVNDRGGFNEVIQCYEAITGVQTSYEVNKLPSILKWPVKLIILAFLLQYSYGAIGWLWQQTSDNYHPNIFWYIFGELIN